MNVVCLTQANLVQGTGNSTFTYRFPNSVQLDNHSVALASLTMLSCWNNVSAALGNNTLSLTIFSADAYSYTYPIVIPDGSYSVADLNSYLQYWAIENSLYLINAAGNYVYFLNVAVNLVRYAIEIQTISCPYNGDAGALPLGWSLPVGFPVAPAVGASWNAVLTVPKGMSDYLGQVEGFATDANSGVGTTLAFLSTICPQIHPTPNVMVSITGISNKYAATPIIYSFSSAGVPFGSMLSERPNELLWSTLNSGTYNELRITFLGTDLRPMTLLDPSITLLLAIKSNLTRE